MNCRARSRREDDVVVGKEDLLSAGAGEKADGRSGLSVIGFEANCSKSERRLVRHDGLRRADEYESGGQIAHVFYRTVTSRSRRETPPLNPAGAINVTTASPRPTNCRVVDL